MGMSISLPRELEADIERAARTHGISPEDFVRICLERAISQNAPEDPLFADTVVYSDDGPVDYAVNHDTYLYGDHS